MKIKHFETPILPEVKQPAFRSGRFSVIRAGVLFFLLYSVVVWVFTECVTNWGALISDWRELYYHEDGTARASTGFYRAEGTLFKALAIPWGFLVYPLTVICAFYYGKRIRKAPTPEWKLIYQTATLIAIAILVRFVWLGVFTSVMATYRL